MIRVERSALSSYASSLLAAGQGVFSADEAQKEIGISRGAFLDAAERLQRRGQLIRPRRGRPSTPRRERRRRNGISTP
jgi:predicted transcriptional regulator of viral defense system